MQKYFFLLLIGAFFHGCVSSRNVKKVDGVRFNASNSSGQDYISIFKKDKGKMKFRIFIDCGRYFTDLGRVNRIVKETYDSEGKYLGSIRFINDSLMLRYFYGDGNVSNYSFTKLSNEEYKVLQKAFLLYPEFASKYSLSADNFNDYLGWFNSK